MKSKLDMSLKPRDKRLRLITWKLIIHPGSIESIIKSIHMLMIFILVSLAHLPLRLQAIAVITQEKSQGLQRGRSILLKVNDIQLSQVFVPGYSPRVYQLPKRKRSNHNNFQDMKRIAAYLILIIAQQNLLIVRMKNAQRFIANAMTFLSYNYVRSKSWSFLYTRKAPSAGWTAIHRSEG